MCLTEVMSRHETPGHWHDLVSRVFVALIVSIWTHQVATSPLYVFPSVFDHPPSRDDAMGALSLIIWTLTAIGLFKYVGLVLHANDNGEGKRTNKPHSHA